MSLYHGNSIIPSDAEHDRHYGNNIKVTRFDVGAGWIQLECDYDGDGRFIELIRVDADSIDTYDKARDMLTFLGCEFKDLLGSEEGYEP